MNTEAIAGYCRACGKPLDQASVHLAHGAIYCQEHVPMDDPSASTASPYSYPSAPPPIPRSDVSPPLAFLLGLIPGVGAIYNSQYTKGLIHVAIVGMAISVLSSNTTGNFLPLIAMLLVAFWAYMPFEAYHTATRRRLGQPVDEGSSLVPLRSSKFPAAPVILIALGVILLLDNLGVLEIQRAFRFWPVLLIGAGVYMLYVRMSPKEPRS